MSTPKPDAYRSPSGRICNPEVCSKDHEARHPGWTPLWFSDTPPGAGPTLEPQELGTVVIDAHRVMAVLANPTDDVQRKWWGGYAPFRFLRWTELAQPIEILHAGYDLKQEGVR